MNFGQYSRSQKSSPGLSTWWSVYS